MSTFDDLMSAADAVLFSAEAFGTRGTYQPVIGDASTITVVIDHQIEPRPDDSEYRLLVDMVEMHIRSSDIDKPRRGDTFTDTTTGAVYTIDHVSRTDRVKLISIARARIAQVSDLLLESGDVLLLESGDALILES